MSAERTALEVVPAVLSAPLLELARTETVAFIRTASGTTLVEPEALIVMYRVSAADAGMAMIAPLIRQKEITKAAMVRNGVSFMYLLSLMDWD